MSSGEISLGIHRNQRLPYDSSRNIIYSLESYCLKKKKFFFFPQKIQYSMKNLMVNIT